MKRIFIILLCFTNFYLHSANIKFGVFTLNKNIPFLSKNKVRLIYKGQIKTLPNIGVIKLVDLPSGSKDKKEFYENLLKKTEIQVNRYWTQLAFSGKGFPPYSLNSNQMQSIINWLKKNPNGIAYSRLDLIPKSAKILYVVEDNS
ncbi:hypothetical protein CF386_10525 [Paraphotobacterium marinum]|uniref:Phosphate ABC transporter substrate-binding protein n=1 Tax=Paraphotobacterium marinum TaxID=1755811 RepID=A0A220VGW6_9GAMM|nr:hypothetical protein [Paraphotobacterium marinum]ASK79486.1 hypothetical protein CF386_10525 [Paraphotobacterium marinum]